MIFNLKENENIYLTKNFKLKEFQCKDNSDIIIIDLKLVDTLQIIRNQINEPIKIISGYRTEDYNKKINGAKKSYHIRGGAIDFICDTYITDYKKIVYIAKELGIKGIGTYNNFIHIDLRYEEYEWNERNI